MKQALIFWFTGLSGSGKTTVATALKPALEASGNSVLIIDGDDVRKRLHKKLGFSEKDIKENNYLIAKLCQEYRKNYNLILVPIISPFIESRKQARALLKKDFFEIYFSADAETVAARDTKGLYEKAKNKEITNLIGYSPGSVYEPPISPDFIVDSKRESISESVNKLRTFILNQLENKQNG